MVMMWQVCFSLMRSSRAASVEDFPDPRGPVTRTMPSRRLAISPSCGGKPRAENSGIVVGITRMTTAQLPRWIKILTRKRASPGKPKEISQEPCSRSMLMACLLSPMRSEAMRRVSSAVSSAQSRTLHRNQLAIDFHLRRTARRENQVADLFGGAQHGRQQGVRGRRTGIRCRIERDLKRCCAWCCHFLLSGSRARLGESAR